MSTSGFTGIRSQEMTAAVDQALAGYANSADLAVSVSIDLQDFQYESNVNGDVVFEAASLLKLPLAMALEEMGAHGQLELRDPQAMEQLLTRPVRNSVIRGLVDTESLSTEELMRLMLIASDELAAHQLRTLIDERDVNYFLSGRYFSVTRLLPVDGRTSVAGNTTANEALRLLSLATNPDAFPITACALASSMMFSRIPLGVTDFDVQVAHKTGSLPGVAHDVAQLTTSQGHLRVAFLSRNQADTVVAGYRMARCTQELLSTCAVSVLSSLSVIRDADG
jgi:beta-lactamase class A